MWITNKKIYYVIELSGSKSYYAQLKPLGSWRRHPQYALWVGVRKRFGVWWRKGGEFYLDMFGFQKLKE